MSELFDNLPESKSPKLIWMERHGVGIKYRNDPSLGDDQWECYKGDYNERVMKVFGDAETLNGESCDPCLNPDFVMAPSEQEAFAEMAERNGWKLWNEE